MTAAVRANGVPSIEVAKCERISRDRLIDAANFEEPSAAHGREPHERGVFHRAFVDADDPKRERRAQVVGAAVRRGEAEAFADADRRARQCKLDGDPIAFERFGVGRQPAAGLREAQGIEFAYEIIDVSGTD